MKLTIPIFRVSPGFRHRGQVYTATFIDASSGALNPDSSKLCYRSNNRGWSMVEILVVGAVVGAVVGVLLALSVGFFRKGVESARQVKCIKNLHTISVGLNQYVQDNNGSLVPAANISATPTVRSHFWYQALEPYIDTNPDPTFRSTIRPTWQQCPEKVFQETTHESSGYGWNFGNFGHRVPVPENPADRQGGGEFTRLARIAKPSSTIIVGDSPDNINAGSHTHRYIYPNNLSSLARRHKGRGNYLFLDGHIEPLSPEKIIDSPDLFSRDN